MKTLFSRSLFASAVVGLLLGGAAPLQAASYTWNVASPGANNWNVNGNWDVANFPGFGGSLTDVATFGATGTAANATTVNNVVSADTTIATLNFTNTTSGAWHVTQIPSGVTLTVSGVTTVGFSQAVNSLVTSAAMNGGGTLALGGNLTIGNNGSSSADQGTILDLSGLTNFVFNAGSANITLSTGNRSGADMKLAAGSNSITAANLNANSASTSSGASGTMTLGAGTNNINVGAISMAAARNNSTMAFPATGGLRLRGVGGTDNDRASLLLANRNQNTSGGNNTGTMNFNGHPVDIKFSTVTMGQAQASAPTGAQAGVGIINFDNGTIDATTILMAISSANAFNSGVATINVGTNATLGTKGTLIIGSGGLSLANQGALGTSTGNLNISGGSLVSSGAISKTTVAGTGNINITNGTLTASGAVGTLAIPLTALNTTNGTITIPASFSSTNVVVGTLNAMAGTSNTINISSLPVIPSYPGQITLIKYTTGSGDLSTFTLGSLPAASPNFQGYISNNVTASSIDLVITNGPTPPPSPKAVVWDGEVSGDWDTTTTNWVNSGVLTNYNNLTTANGGDPVTFDDTLLGTTNVNLTQTLSPVSITVNNTASNYFFTGTGKLSGTGTLTKSGAGSLVVANSGVNDISGGITINAGTLQFGSGGTAGNFPTAGGALNNGSLVFNHSDSITVSGVISGSGTVTQNGSGTLTLSGANTYAGTTAINTGKVIANNASGTTLASSLGAIPGGAVTVAAGATLDIENGTANSIAFTNNNTLTAKQFNVAGAGVDGNGVIVNNGSVNQQSAFQNISLTADATFGGLARWDMRGNASIIPQLNLNGFTLTKTNPVQISLVNVVANAGNIDLKEGVLSFEGSSAVNGPADGSQGTITVRPAGAFGHFRTWGGAVSRPIVLNGGSITNLSTSGGASTNDSPINLTANSTVIHATGSDLYLRGPISGAFGITKLLSGTTLLAGTNIYSGNTVVGAGTLALTLTGSISNTANITISNGATLSASGRTDGTLWLSAGQTLKGNGTVVGTLALGAGSTVAPGFSVGALADTGAVTLQGGGTEVVEVIGISNAAAGVGYDTLTASGAITVQSTSGNRFNIKLVSLDGTGVAGAVTNFDNTVTNYAWTIISGSSISGYSADKFSVDESTFANVLGGAHFVVKSTATALQVALNHAPAASPASVNRTGGETLKILVANLATNWSDPDGNTVTFSSVSALSGNGFAVTTDGTNIFYSGADNQNDSFTYTISDGFQTASGSGIL